MVPSSVLMPSARTILDTQDSTALTNWKTVSEIHIHRYRREGYKLSNKVIISTQYILFITLFQLDLRFMHQPSPEGRIRSLEVRITKCASQTILLEMMKCIRITYLTIATPTNDLFTLLSKPGRIQRRVAFRTAQAGLVEYLSVRLDLFREVDRLGTARTKRSTRSRHGTVRPGARTSWTATYQCGTVARSRHALPNGWGRPGVTG